MPEPSDSTKFVAIVDFAYNSTVTSVYAFEGGSPGAAIPKVYSKQGWTLTDSETITSYFPDEASSHDSETLSSQLEFLSRHIDHLRSVVPENQYESTAVLIHGTDGMRPRSSVAGSWPNNTAQLALRSATQFFDVKSPFPISYNDTSAVVEGYEQAAMSWVALNYINNIFENFSNSTSIGYLSIDRSFASVAYIPPEIDHVLYKRDSHQQNHLTIFFLLGNETISLHAQHWIGGGYEQGYGQYETAMLADSNVVEEPCVARGAPSAVAPIAPFDSRFVYDADYADWYSYTLNATGDAQRCIDSIESVAESFGLAHRELELLGNAPLDMKLHQNHFAAFVETGGLGFEEGPLLEAQLQEHMVTNCNSKFSELEETFPGASDKQIALSCFEACWTQYMLQMMGFPLNEVRKDKETIDTLYRDAQNMSQVIQVFDTFGSTNVSWRLGRALLYAQQHAHPDEYVGIQLTTDGIGQQLRFGLDNSGLPHDAKKSEGHGTGTHQDELPHSASSALPSLLWILCIGSCIFMLVKTRTRAMQKTVRGCFGARRPNYRKIHLEDEHYEDDEDFELRTL